MEKWLIVFLILIFSVNLVADEEVTNLKIIPGNSVLKFIWELTDKSNVKEIEILKGKSKGGTFTQIKTEPAISNSTEIKFDDMEKYYFKVRVIFLDGKVSNGSLISMRDVVRDKVDRYKLQVYLPYDYNYTQERYPVVYIFDGQNIFYNGKIGTWEVNRANA